MACGRTSQSPNKGPLVYNSIHLHADHPSLCKFASDCAPSHVVLFHADETAANALAEDIGQETKVHIPSNDDTLDIVGF